MKVIRELGIAAGIAAVVTVLLSLVTLDISTVTDWRAWAIGLLSLIIRAASAAAIARLRDVLPGSVPTEPGV